MKLKIGCFAGYNEQKENIAGGYIHYDAIKNQGKNTCI